MERSRLQAKDQLHSDWQRLKAAVISEHVCFVRAGGLESGHLLPVPRTEAALEVLVAHRLERVAARQFLDLRLVGPAKVAVDPQERLETRVRRVDRQPQRRRGLAARTGAGACRVHPAPPRPEPRAPRPPAPIWVPLVPMRPPMPFIIVWPMTCVELTLPPTSISMAVFIGKTRLIDNVVLG